MPMIDVSLQEWLNLLVRWFHIFAGILWIGATWYFTWLDRQLHAALAAKERGVFMVHSGGFYVVEKLKDPKVDPALIHWFRFEALFTWLSGLLLLGIVYYWGGGVMTDDAVSSIGESTAIGIGLGAIVLGWLAYDALWRSPLGKSQLAGAGICFVALLAAAYALTHLLSGRAAYIHLGAMLGTIMTLNVWRRILPNQKKLVAALAAGEQPDQALAAEAKGRSTHNTFIILPVLMTMISNHFPTATYGSQWNWAVFGALTLLGWGAAQLARKR
jgi:uncharacterized membrane protein